MVPPTRQQVRNSYLYHLPRIDTRDNGQKSAKCTHQLPYCRVSRHARARFDSAKCDRHCSAEVCPSLYNSVRLLHCVFNLGYGSSNNYIVASPSALSTQQLAGIATIPAVKQVSGSRSSFGSLLRTIEWCSSLLGVCECNEHIGFCSQVGVCARESKEYYGMRNTRRGIGAQSREMKQ